MSQKTTIDELQVLITANAASFNKQLQAVQRQLDGLDKNTKFSSKSFLGSMNGMKVAALAAAAAITIAMSKAIASSTRFFGDFEQNAGGAKAIFGDYAGFVQKKAWEAAHAMGMSINEYLQTANKIGAIMQGSGLTQAQSLKMTTEWMQRAADQASVMGVSTSEAMMAITGAAKGNFTMMDNIGVKMSATTLEAYALSKGIATSFDSMSEAQKIGLAYELFLERTNYAAGNFAREGATTMNGALVTLRANFKNLGIMLGQAFAPMVLQVANFVSNYLLPALQAIIPYVVAFMKVVGQAVSYVGGLIAGLFGGGAKSVQAVSDSANSAASSVKSVASAATGAGKALGGAAKEAKKLKGQLAGFDEMNVITEPQTNSGGGGAGGGGSVPSTNMPKFEFNPFGEMEKKVSATTEKIKKYILDLIKLFDFSALTKSIRTFSKGFQHAFKGVLKIGDKFINNFLLPIAKFQIESTIPRVLEAIGKALNGIDFTKISEATSGVFTHLGGIVNSISNALANIVEVLAPIGQWFANFVLPPVFEILATSLMLIRSSLDGIWQAIQIIGSILGPVFGAFGKQLEPLFDLLGKLFGWIQKNETAMNILKTTFTVTVNVILGPVIAAFVALGGALTAVTWLINQAVKMFTEGWESVKSVWSMAGEFFRGVWTNISKVFSETKQFFSNTFTGALNSVKSVWNGLGNFFSGVWNGVKNTLNGIISWVGGSFSSAWSAVWNGVKTIFSNIVNGFGNIFKAPLNFMIGSINGFIRGLNRIKIPDWVPAVGGKGIHIAEIPKLARGGLVSSATIAMIGEAGREAVLPLDRNTGWMDELASKINNNTSGAPIHLTVQIGDEVLLNKLLDGFKDISLMRNMDVLL